MRFLIGIFLVFFALPLHAAEINEKDHERIMRYLNMLSTMQADFLQTGANGEISSGVFSLSRPGKLRWEYKKPDPILIILKHKIAAYYDVELDELTQVTDNVLASFLADENLTLPNEKLTIKNNTSAAGVFSITVIKRKNPEEGEVTLRFSQDDIKLIGISVKDANAEITEVKLTNHKYGIALADNLFSFPKTRSPAQSRKSF